MRKILFAIVGAFMLVLSLSGCSSTVKGEVKPIIVQETLLQKCTKDTPLPENPARDKDNKIILDAEGKPLYDGKEMMRVLVRWDQIYSDCATTHDSLVDTIRKIEATSEVKTK